MKRLLFFLILGLMPLAYGQQVNPVTGNITASSTDCSTANSCVSIGLAPNTGTVAIDLTGSGPFSGTVQFEGVICSTGAVCGTWASLSCTPPGSTTGVTSATATGAWRCAVSALTKVRVRGSAYSSGTAAITITASPTSASLGGGGGGTVGPGTTNYIPLFATATTVGNSHMDDGATTASTITSTEPMNFTASGAGMAGFTQGTDNSASCPAQSICLEASTGVTQHIVVLPAIPGSGALDVQSNGASPPVLTAFYSGDSNHATIQKSETNAADTNVLTLTPPATIGTYRVTVTASVSSATSGVIGFTISYKDSNGNAQTNQAVSLFQLGTAAPALTFTVSAAGNYYGKVDIDIDNSATAIVVKWVGGGTTAAKVSVHIERI